ncbi:MAG: GLPGLI family protein, partial [Bernardetiaceae bacterium]
MKHTFLFCLYFFVSLISLTAQETLEVIYRADQMNMPEEKIPKSVPAHMVSSFILMSRNPDFYVLRQSGEFSQYAPLYPDIEDPKGVINGQNVAMRKIYYRNYLVIKDFNENALMYRTKNSISGLQTIKSDFLDHGWELHDSTKTVLDYPCKMATGRNETNNTVTAWYTEDIPIPNGPQLLTGLPGLILEINMNKFVTTATKISFPESIPDFEALQSEKAISLEEYMEQQEKAM